MYNSAVLRPAFTPLIAILALFPGISGAGGFESPGIGARALSMGGAFVSVADDWTAIYWNPAGLSRIKGSGIGISADIVRVRSHDSSGLANPTLPLSTDNLLRGDVFAQTGGEPSQFSGQDSSFWIPLPAVGFYTTRCGVSLAGGSYAPLGFSYRVSDGAQPGYQTSYASKGYILNHNISLAKEVFRGVRFGAGVNAVQARLSRAAYKSAPTYTYSASSDADGLGVQGVFGVLIDLGQRARLGGVYRTGQDLALSGRAAVQDSRFPGESSDFTQKLRNPATYGAGVSWLPRTHWTITADWQRSEWQSSRIDVSFVQPGLFLQNLNLDPEWTSSTRYRFGVEWRLAPAWSCRAGYFRDPAGTSFRSTSLTNLVTIDQRYFTLGAGYQQSRWRLNLGGQYSQGREDLPGRALRRDNVSILIGFEYFV